MGRMIHIAVDSSVETTEVRSKWENIFEVMGEKNCQPTYTEEIPFRNENVISHIRWNDTKNLLPTDTLFCITKVSSSVRKEMTPEGQLPHREWRKSSRDDDSLYTSDTLLSFRIEKKCLMAENKNDNIVKRSFWGM